MRKILILVAIALIFTSCGFKKVNIEDKEFRVYKVEKKDDLKTIFAPEIAVEEFNNEYNKIGLVNAFLDEKGDEKIGIDVNEPVYYFDKRGFKTKKGEYTNLIYRVHFTKTPDGHLGKGNNVGLIFIVTLNDKNNPLLFTSVHTCGCYLAFLPTSYLDKDFLPDNWKFKDQKIHGEVLPYEINYKEDSFKDYSIRFFKRDATHRIMDVKLIKDDSYKELNILDTSLLPLDTLENLKISDERTTSFYETKKGPGFAFVKGSEKIYERIFMSWWALDWRIGQDKKLGKNRNDGTTFYTSIKPWARDESDMRDFKGFLKYWGWKF
jgi:hypothetical protein